MLLGALATGACADEGDDDRLDGGSGGKADDIAPESFACKNVQGITLEALAQIDDPITDLLVQVTGDGFGEQRTGVLVGESLHRHRR